MVGETMDGLAYTVMQIFTVILLVGTLGLSFFVGKVWKKNNGYQAGALAFAFLYKKTNDPKRIVCLPLLIQCDDQVPLRVLLCEACVRLECLLEQHRHQGWNLVYQSG